MQGKIRGVLNNNTVEVVRSWSKELRLYPESHGEPLKVSMQGSKMVSLVQEAAQQQVVTTLAVVGSGQCTEWLSPSIVHLMLLKHC